MTSGAPATPSGPFSRTAAALVSAAIAASLAGMIVLSVFLDDIAGRPSASADGYSVSAIGHRGLVEVLEELDVPVVVSRHGSAAKAEGGVLVVAEPVVPVDDAAAAARLHALVTSAEVALVVLPKWYGTPAADNRRWLADLALLEVAEAEAVLRALGSAGRVVRGRPGEVVLDTLDLGRPDLRLLPDHELAQLVADEDAVVHVLERGALVLELLVGDTTVYVLTDPDVLNNAGLLQPGNAGLVVTLLDRLRDGGAVVIDETLHGFAEEPSLWKALFRFPLALVTLHVGLLALVVVWAGLGRFGPARGAPPPLAAGKEYLVRNTAALLRVAGHHGHALGRYLATAVEAVRHELHAPRELSARELPAWLERVRAARGGTIPFPELEDEVQRAIASRNPRAVLAAADRVHRWRQELIHGPRNHP